MANINFGIEFRNTFQKKTIKKNLDIICQFTVQHNAS